MRRFMVTTAVVLFLFVTDSRAQSGAALPQPDAAHASQASCVILKRMGRIARAESRLPSLGIRGKQFRYVEGKLPEGFSFHGKMTDQDVLNLQARGATVFVLESHYTSEDLQEARADCGGKTGKAPNHAELKASAAPAPETVASGPTPTPNSPAPKTPTSRTDDSPPSSTDTEAALLDVSSTPAGADVYVDDHLSGQTPATLILEPGSHRIAIKRSGFVVWQRKLKLPGGHTNVDAELVPKAK